MWTIKMANASYTSFSLHDLLSTYIHAGNETSVKEDLYTVPVGIVVLLAILYGSISLVAVLGNGLVILVIAKNRKMQTVTNIFIANLALADVIIGIFSTPFQFQPALHQRWDLPEFLCKVAPSFKTLSVNVSVFTLTVIAVDRYVAVLYPLKAGFSKKTAVLGLAFIWIIGIVSSFPEALYFQYQYVYDPVINDLKPFCRDDWPTKNFGKFYHLYIFIVQYLLPLCVINFSYIRIAIRIWGTKQPGHATETDNVRQRNKRKYIMSFLVLQSSRWGRESWLLCFCGVLNVMSILSFFASSPRFYGMVVKMLIIVVCLFVICWMPLQIYGFLSEIYAEINNYKFINIIWFCSNWLAMSNSCYNPFIYGLLNEKFKLEYRLLFSRSRCLKRLNRKPSHYPSEMSRESKRTRLSYRTDTIHLKLTKGRNGCQEARYSKIPHNGGLSVEMTSEDGTI